MLWGLKGGGGLVIQGSRHVRPDDPVPDAQSEHSHVPEQGHGRPGNNSGAALACRCRTPGAAKEEPPQHAWLCVVCGLWFESGGQRSIGAASSLLVRIIGRRSRRLQQPAFLIQSIDKTQID